MNNQLAQNCDVCDAPYRNPLTARALKQGWRITEYTVGTRHFVQTHRPNCPMGGNGRPPVGYV